MVSIVTDKEQDGIIMKMIGLKPSVYWTLPTYRGCKDRAYMIMIQMWISFRFRIFTFHEQFQYTLMLFLFSNVSVMFSFFLSTFFTKTNTTLAVSFLFTVLSFQLGLCLFICVCFWWRSSVFLRPIWASILGAIPVFRRISHHVVLPRWTGVSFSLDNDWIVCFHMLWFIGASLVHLVCFVALYR